MFYRWRSTCCGGLRIESGSALLNWGLKGPIRSVQFSNHFQDQDASTTSNLLFGNLQHRIQAAGYQFMGFRWGRTKLLTGVELQQGEKRSRPSFVLMKRS
jgi:hypothetical protein